MDGVISLGMNEILLPHHIKKPIEWGYNKYPHLIIFGSTGSGKTYLLKEILGRISLHIHESELIICDFKGDSDFSFLHGRNFFRFTECMNGLKRGLDCLKARQQDASCDRYALFLVFDEWASFLNSLDKKEAEKAKADLSTILMLGRSFNIHVILSQQRLDAEYFGKARDNFSVIIGMGTISKESVQMMFADYKDVIDTKKERGRGSVVMGSQFYNLAVPVVRNQEKLDACIQAGISRYETLFY